MIQIDFLKNFFPVVVRENPSFQKYMLKEYLQLLILDFLSTTPYIGKISFIGGTNLRLVKGIDRFSEDLDFDCKNLSSEEFTEMTNAVINFLQRSGYHIEVRDKESTKLKAFRRNIHFPELLYILGLSGHKDERFLIKLECQDQQVDYKRSMVNIKGCGFFFPFPVPTDGVLCSMKISAMLSRQKGRDFYDSMFLLSFTTPNYQFLTAKLGIHDFSELKMATKAALNTVDLNLKRRDFEHLLFSRKNSERILSFWDFLQEMK